MAFNQEQQIITGTTTSDTATTAPAMAGEAQQIEVYGAREHNLKNISIKLPRYQLVVFTGISGSGKSSLAFDTIYAEGQRRYMETFSAYARSFMGGLERPDVDKIEGLSPFPRLSPVSHPGHCKQGRRRKES